MLFGQEAHWVKNRPVSDKYIVEIITVLQHQASHSRGFLFPHIFNK